MLPLMLGILLSTPKSLTVAMERDHSIFVGSLDSHGNWLAGKRPHSLCGLPRNSGWIFWTPSGMLQYEKDTERFVVDPNGNGRIRKPKWTDYVWRSRDQMLAVIVPQSRGDLILKDRATNKTQVLTSNAQEVTWSRDGRMMLALVHPVMNSFDEYTLAFDLPSGKQIWKSETTVNNVGLVAGNGQRLMAYESHLSRPLTGSNLIDIKSNSKDIDLPHPENLAPTEVDDLSPDGKSALLCMRVPDPKNDGSWKYANVVLWKIGAKAYKTVGIGSSAQFTPDGKHILFVAEKGPGKTGNLSRYDINSGTKTVLAKNVHFATYR